MTRRRCLYFILWTLGWTIWATERAAEGVSSVQAELLAKQRAEEVSRSALADIRWRD